MHHPGMEVRPECQYAQIFFSDDTGRKWERDSMISSSVRVSFGETYSSSERNSSGIVKDFILKIRKSLNAAGRNFINCAEDVESIESYIVERAFQASGQHLIPFVIGPASV